MADEIINKEGSPVGEPSKKETEGTTEKETIPQNTDDELTKKIKEILAEQFKDISGQYTSAITELQDKTKEVEQEKYKMQVNKLLGDSKILDGRFFDFVYSNDIELVKTRIENLENLINEIVGEMAQNEVNKRLDASAWTPGDNSSMQFESTFKKPSYMV
ncbi:MAG: hypothetical protein KZY55_13650 [Paeniclostridium sp.]|nr:hypothetical protein [Paeniclostridium sp.]MBW4862640.1 hypothetical protein [Paeniclostridium sp.]MBW4875100.1 hypothetical protein [Paeniclostridium sp.]